MAKRHRDATAIQLGACNPSGIAHSVVYARDGKAKGVPTGGTKRCRTEGCTGLRVGVRWADKRITWPCTKGMLPYKDGEIIG